MTAQHSLWQRIKNDLKNPAFVLALVTGIVTMCGGVAAGTWVISKHTFNSQMEGLQQELAFYKDTKDVDIPKLLEEFGRFVTTANAELELKKLRADYEDLNQSYDQLESRYLAIKETVKLEEQFSLEEGQSRTVLNGTVIIGMRAIRDDYAFVTLRNKDELVHVGESIPETLGETQYRIVFEEVLKTEPSKAQFRIDELPASN